MTISRSYFDGTQKIDRNMEDGVRGISILFPYPIDLVYYIE